MGRKFARLDRFGRGRKSRPLEKLAVERSSGQRLVDEARVGSWFIASSVGVLKWFAIVGVRLDICASLLAWVGDSGGPVDAAERDVACVLTPSWSARGAVAGSRFPRTISGGGDPAMSGEAKWKLIAKRVVADFEDLERERKEE
ncbi:hypothetical protein XPA_006920 [Xanthoria parietina]